MPINFGIPTDLQIAGNLTVNSLNGLLKGTAGLVSVAVAGTDYATPAQLTSSGVQLGATIASLSGLLITNLALTGGNLYVTLTGLSGQANANYATTINLGLTGQALYNLTTALSGALVTQIMSAAGVLSLNGATGFLTLASAPANANYVGVSNSGTTIYVSGLSTPTLSGITLPGGGIISGNTGTIYLDARNTAEIRTISGDMRLGGGLIAFGPVTALSAGFNGGSLGTVIPNIAVVGGQFNHGGIVFANPGDITDYKAVISAGIAGGAGQGVLVVYAGGSSSQTRLFDFNGNTNNTNAQNVSYARLLVGSATQLNNGFLQIATHTTSGGGLALGPDNTIWRTAANVIATDGRISLGTTGDYTAANAASVAQLFAISGGLLAAIGAGAVASVVYTTGAQTIGGAKTFAGSNLIVTGGNVGIGTTTPAYTLEVSGSFGATTKSFDIQHPTRPGMRLTYGVTESPEHSVFYNTTLHGSGFAQLPDHWRGLVHEDSIRVILTPIGCFQPLYVAGWCATGVYVESDGVTDIYAFVRAEARRKDVEPFAVEHCDVARLIVEKEIS